MITEVMCESTLEAVEGPLCLMMCIFLQWRKEQKRVHTTASFVNATGSRVSAETISRRLNNVDLYARSMLLSFYYEHTNAGKDCFGVMSIYVRVRNSGRKECFLKKSASTLRMNLDISYVERGGNSLSSPKYSGN